MTASSRSAPTAPVVEPPRQSVTGLLAYCRQGFEPELAAELSTRAAQVGYPGYARTERNSGYVVLVADDAARLNHALPWRQLIFARQKMQLLAELKDLDAKDRITPILEVLRQQHPELSASGADIDRRPAYGDVWVEHPDSDAAKPLAGLARSFANALRPTLRKQGLLSARENPHLPRLHVMFADGQHAFVGRNQAGDGAPWPLGIPRLKLLPDAPSRSALKLEEALLSLLDGQQREQLLKAGMTAADLGAAPGGWTWVLTRQHLRVSSIDNGPLRQHLMDTGLVEHLRADGFHWKPEKPLDWMVCDMVEQPRRVAERMASWFREGWCRHAIFNLKLPMKKRWDETTLCLDLFEQQAGRRLDIRAKQLYHDREEITVFATSSNTR